jgi:hypothetical protein
MYASLAKPQDCSDRSSTTEPVQKVFVVSPVIQLFRRVCCAQAALKHAKPMILLKSPSLGASKALNMPLVKVVTHVSFSWMCPGFGS